ncbi:Na+-transporting NADH:ubiquinone oxidoreductase subunit A [Nitrosomonas cryotolerans]|uniref:Na(+)-translocating NADH-quinone reductase subunit A n=1 Tax=Nitrosomonas cryotolerans ATCC 49181 TaxID=1131553 RepID=A0A1N6JJC6_9PROT|nr:Na(+)-translocating NADH-quinone reductase subunit A [Nitrosomonas cryotolerans]SFQ03870.1 Na+-transporting NADH:ubiquinone oxidoreductase subunit A [Nitrosomonas cryotolerans]SIO44380.1 Na+-transporting NADH:ubiquinone oxidoreductase subunit A [Nitrosomonas cryotolerans ATCC 49181]
MLIKIQKGLDLPISGKPKQQVERAPAIRHVAMVGADYIDLKPTMLVAEGDVVKLGQTLCKSKKLPDICFTAPGAGEIIAIHRGAQRTLQSIVIRLDETEAEEVFAAYSPDQLSDLTADQIIENLLLSGLWTALRTRPYSKTPDPDTRPSAIFVTAIDSNPLAADPAPIITAEAESFGHGLRVLAQLTTDSLWVCKSSEAEFPLPDNLNRLQLAHFEGPHPAGLVGTHIHFIAPVNAHKTVWHLNYQDVIAIGKLFVSGRLWTQRIIALGGPQIKRPRLLQTRLGASLDELLSGEHLQSAENRIISGSVWSGRRAADWSAYLGRYHLQISVLKEEIERKFMGWLAPGRRKYSQLNVMLSSFFRNRGETYAFTTSQNGDPRAMIPTGSFEAVMPLDILPTQLLRYLVVGDTDMAQKLGCLELDEEDLALCSFTCVGKHDYGTILRENLRQIEKEG